MRGHYLISSSLRTTQWSTRSLHQTWLIKFPLIHPLKKNALWRKHPMKTITGYDLCKKNTWGLFCTFSCSLVHTIWTDRPKRKTKCLPTTCKEGRWLCPPQFLQHSPLMTILIIVWKTNSSLKIATNARNVHQSRQTHTNWQSLEEDQRESTHYHNYHHNQHDHHQVHHDHHNIKSWPAPDKVSWFIIRRSYHIMTRRPPHPTQHPPSKKTLKESLLALPLHHNNKPPHKKTTSTWERLLALQKKISESLVTI